MVTKEYDWECENARALLNIESSARRTKNLTLVIRPGIDR